MSGRNEAARSGGAGVYPAPGGSLHARLAAVLLGVAASSAGAVELPPEQAAARARQVAELLELQSLVEPVPSAAPSDPLETHLARWQRRDDALIALHGLSLLVDATMARIDREQFASASARDVVNSRSAQSVATWNIAALLVGNGTTVVGSALQLGNNQTEAQVGNGLIVAGAIISTGFGVVALVRKNQGRPQYAIETNFLARPLDRPPASDSELPEPIWRYLDTPLVGEQGSYRSQLVERWVHGGSISLAHTPAALRTIELLTRPLSERDTIVAELLGTRAHMLADLRSQVAAMKVDLQLLVRQVGTHH